MFESTHSFNAFLPIQPRKALKKEFRGRKFSFYFHDLQIILSQKLLNFHSSDYWFYLWSGIQKTPVHNNPEQNLKILTTFSTSKNPKIFYPLYRLVRQIITWHKSCQNHKRKFLNKESLQLIYGALMSRSHNETISP
jgi:hypothetical protein